MKSSRRASRVRNVFIGIISTFIVCFSSQAKADLPPAQYWIGIDQYATESQYNSGYNLQTGAHLYHDLNGSVSVAKDAFNQLGGAEQGTASVYATPSPTLSVSSNRTAPIITWGQSEADLVYYFMVSSPLSTTVQAQFNYSFESGAQLSNDSWSAQYGFYEVDMSVVIKNQSSNMNIFSDDNDNVVGSIQKSQTLSLNTNTVYSVTLQDYILNYGYGYIFSILDPTITITSDGPLQLTLSPGIGNDLASPVPEPAAMLLFGTGIAGLAAFGRRNRN